MLNCTCTFHAKKITQSISKKQTIERFHVVAGSSLRRRKVGVTAEWEPARALLGELLDLGAQRSADKVPNF